METDTLGTEAMPYDPDNPVHEAIAVAGEVIKAAEDKIEVSTEDKVEIVSPPEDTTILDAIKELTTNVSEMAKQLKEMNEAHKKWIKAGKF